MKPNSLGSGGKTGIRCFTATWADGWQLRPFRYQSLCLSSMLSSLMSPRPPLTFPSSFSVSSMSFFLKAFLLMILMS
jgi:hypothetical protein